MNKFFGRVHITQDTYMAMTIQDNLLEMLQVCIVYEGPEIGAVRWRNWKYKRIRKKSLPGLDLEALLCSYPKFTTLTSN